MVRLLTLMLLSLALLGLGGCDDSCTYANDGECDEPFLCPNGSDTSDCRPGTGGGCSDTCQYAFDGECDDGGAGADTSLCLLGSDCSDCGVR